MKSWIKNILRETLDEINIKDKCEFGSGCFHTVYPSNKNPDRLYKIGPKKTVLDWVDIFKSNPKIFPRVYRVFPSTKSPYYLIVEIEKLNVEQAKADYQVADDNVTDLSEKLFSKNETINFPYNLIRIHEIDSQGITLPRYLKMLNIHMLESGVSDSNRLLTIKWVKTIYSIYKMLETKHDFKMKDLHRDNVAYDKNGNIKIIDI